MKKSSILLVILLFFTFNLEAKKVKIKIKHCTDAPLLLACPQPQSWVTPSGQCWVTPSNIMWFIP